ncbi:hypothetical protein [Emticicia sp. BO119]|uniref:hypothetical protein n=1 Tax=Emticicia sp. BO119 TaxID=2757768 RepID=UPI0015F050D7|nr:hypothetical protein [Emticicia sp. BO119]MBA4850318.1 hypothetical protein [Emticicia sp. BO119]
MVGTFLNENGDKLLKISALTIQLKPEKVTNTVGTFLNKDTINAIKLVSEKTKKIIEEIPGINK